MGNNSAHVKDCLTFVEEIYEDLERGYPLLRLLQEAGYAMRLAAPEIRTLRRQARLPGDERSAVGGRAQPGFLRPACARRFHAGQAAP